MLTTTTLHYNTIMSTDANQTPVLPPFKKWGYMNIVHTNSNRSIRRGLVQIGKPFTTFQTLRHPEGGPLPHRTLLTKKSRYIPHVGAKQLAKLSN